MDWKDHATTAAPGLLGALVALRWVGGTPWQLAAAFVGGSAASFYGTGHLVAWSGANPGLSGFLIGLFGMATASRVFEAIAAIPIARVVEKVLHRLGL
jgi:hypothetical protein